jgi:hypothetical protein
MRRIRFLLALALLACQACGWASRRSAAPSCGPEIAGDQQLAAPLVLVGDFHGTREIPAAFGHLVCHAAAARSGVPILVGLEILSSAQAAIDTFLAGEGGAAATRSLLAQEFWQREYQDGRSSRAMLDLLDELRRQRKAGLNLVVRALDPPHFDSSSGRDAAMAASLVEAIAAVRPAKTFVLVGNVHTRTLHGYPWDPKADYVPLGALLRERYGDLIALDVKALGGSAWTCTSAAAADCGVHALTHREPTGPTPRIVLDPASAATTGYSGVLFVGELTASTPARSPES